jgi:hypothetical protein
MSGLEGIASRHAAVAVALVAAGAVCVLTALHVAYRRTLLRMLRDRHPDVWEELARPGWPEWPWSASARRVAAFLRAGRHYALNDADLAAAGRLCLVTGRAAAVVAVVGALLTAALGFPLSALG